MEHRLVYVTQFQRKDLLALYNYAHHHHHHYHHNVYDFTGLRSKLP